MNKQEDPDTLGGGGINRSRVGYKENFKKGGTKCADEVEGQPASRYKL